MADPGAENDRRAGKPSLTVSKLYDSGFVSCNGHCQPLVSEAGGLVVQTIVDRTVLAHAVLYRAPNVAN